MPDGCLIVNKPRGLSSHDVIDKIRRIYKVKCGHAGTLDPMAQGVLLVFTGRALKLINFIPPEHLDKTYLMKVTLGKTTDSYDATGNITSVYDQPVDFTSERLMTELRSLVGSYDQMPPAFSAIKVGGKRAYALARAGENVELKKRRVHVTSIRLVSDFVSNSERHLVLRVHCSRGTYVRSIAHDLGQKLGCGGHLSYLLRERVGKWAFNNAFPFWKAEKGIAFSESPAFVPLTEILPFPRLKVSVEAQQRIGNGQPIGRKDIISLETDSPEACDTVQILSTAGNLIAIYNTGKDKVDSQKNGLKLFPVRVFAENET
jgi:tRNA pseudouridine55 synthase